MNWRLAKFYSSVLYDGAHVWFSVHCHVVWYSIRHLLAVPMFVLHKTTFVDEAQTHRRF